jgi:hypothetical protein
MVAELVAGRWIARERERRGGRKSGERTYKIN